MQIDLTPKNTFQPDTYFIHKYGGIYLTEPELRHDDQQRPLVAYTHIYPFKAMFYTRPLTEWTDETFRPISTEQMGAYIARNPRSAMQQLIGIQKNQKLISGEFLTVIGL